MAEEDSTADLVAASIMVSADAEASEDVEGHSVAMVDSEADSTMADSEELVAAASEAGVLPFTAIAEAATEKLKVHEFLL